MKRITHDELQIVAIELVNSISDIEIFLKVNLTSRSLRVEIRDFTHDQGPTLRAMEDQILVRDLKSSALSARHLTAIIGRHDKPVTYDRL